MTSDLSPWVADDFYQSLPSPPSSVYSTHDDSSLDAEDLSRRLRAWRPRQEDLIAERQAFAKRDYDLLIELGGRPSRPVRQQPLWKGIHEGCLIHIESDELESTYMDSIYDHWVKESRKFRSELEQWQSFREWQQNCQNKGRLETQLELDNTDAGLVEVLTRLSDWQEFEIFYKNSRSDGLYLEDRCRQSYLQINGVSAEYSETSSAVHKAIRTWLHQFGPSQQAIEIANHSLNWIWSQWPKVVAESVNSLSTTPKLQSMLEAKFKKQTHAAFNAVQKLGGQPSHAVSPPPESMDISQRILYWSSESSNYMEELLDWETFLSWRLLGDKPRTQQQAYECPQFQSRLDFYVEFEKFRSFQYTLASFWLQCRQRVVRWFEKESEIYEPHVPETAPGCLKDFAKAFRLQVRQGEQRLVDAGMRLEKAVQEHAHALSETVHITGGETKESLPTPILPTPPLSCSESPSSSHSSPSVQPYPSPPSSQSSQSSRSQERPSKNPTPSSKSSTAEKRHRRSKKEAARRAGPRQADTNTTQQPLPTLSPGPLQVERDDDVEMVDAPEDPEPAEVIDEFKKPESEDTVMTDSGMSSSDTPSCSSKSPSRPISRYEALEIRFVGRNPTLKSRKNQSPTKRDQAPSGGVPKPTGKKPSKKVKKFTEQQTTMPLNAASNSGCPTDSPGPRRSERLKEKAAASAIISQSQLNTSQTPQPSDHKQPQKQAGQVEPSRPPKRKISELQLDALEPPETPRRKKPKIQLDAPEPPQTPRHNEPKIQLDAPEPTQTPRHKKLTIQLDAPELPQTSKLKKPTMNSKANEPSRRQKKLQKRARDASRTV